MDDVSSNLNEWNQLTDVFRSVFNQKDIVLKKELTAWNIPGWDSLAHLRLIIMIEKKFAIQFSTPEIVDLNSVGDLFELILDKMRKEG